MVTLPSDLELQELKKFKQDFCVTIYAPCIERGNGSTNPNLIELKNLLKQAETELASAKLKTRDIRKTLRNAYALIDEDTFWAPRNESLVLFMHQSFFRYYFIPNHKTNYILTVSNGFNVKPVENIIKNNRPYFLLFLSHNLVSLYQGDKYHIRKLHFENLPSNMKNTLQIDEYPKWRETHSVGPTSNGKGSEASHGQYNIAETDKQMIKEFFRRIDSYLHFYLNLKQEPLILSGVNYLLPIYRQVNTYTKLTDKQITGNWTKKINYDTLRNKAWKIMQQNNQSKD